MTPPIQSNLDGTPTGLKVRERLSAFLDRLDKAVGIPAEYKAVKPLDLIVITDGVPSGFGYFLTFLASRSDC